MIETATGVVLRTYPFTETSLIVHWITPQFGRMGTLAKGARGPKSSFRGKLDIFYLADFSFQRSRRSDLHTLREVSIRDAHAFLRRDLAYLQQASYCAALLNHATESETPLPEFFALFRDLLACLPSLPARPQTVLAFELKLLDQLGLGPDFSSSRLSAATVQAAERLLAQPWSGAAHVELSPPMQAELGRFLHGFIVYHLGRLPSGRERALGG